MTICTDNSLIRHVEVFISTLTNHFDIVMYTCLRVKFVTIRDSTLLCGHVNLLLISLWFYYQTLSFNLWFLIEYELKYGTCSVLSTYANSTNFTINKLRTQMLVKGLQRILPIWNPKYVIVHSNDIISNFIILHV